MAKGMMEDLVGQTLGQYELKEIAGEGGLATVYKAYQPTLERWVAIKVLHSNNKTLLARFEREAKAVAKLRHHNILTVYEYSVDQDWPYIAMEFVEQGTLENYLKGEPLPWLYVAKLAKGIAEALYHAHGHGLIHRDVKPSNILLPEEDWPMLADFGLVKLSNPAQALTDSDMVMGTPSYIPPEQANAQSVDGRTDMYSLGVVMFEMITGRLPFAYSTPHSLMLAHVREPAPSPCEFNPGCPDWLEKIILTALQKSPDDRYANLQVMIDALTDILNEATTPFFHSQNKSSQVAGGDTLPAPVWHTPPLEGAVSRRGVRILLKEQNVVIDVPDLAPEADGLIIGRTHSKAQADIDLEPYGAIAAGISRQHARLIRQGDDWLIDDLRSLNGTYVNKRRIKPGAPVRLENGDLIRCSRMSLIFLIS